ncbi:MAG TPA: ComEC/Rec2 family competence protein, partial [Actinomycetota bacterium]|nr:ComEC/Rec2 family competence protein [Actinomycetota bacterium]
MTAAARLWVLAAFFTLGILSGSRLTAMWLMVTAGGLGLILLILAWVSHKRSPSGPFPSLSGSTSALVLVGVMLIGAASTSVRLASMQSSSLAMVDGPVDVDGVVRADPVKSGRSARLLVDVERLDGRTSSGLVEIRLYEDPKGIKLGDRIKVGALLRPLDTTDDLERRKLFRSITATGSAFSAVRVEQRSSNHLLRFAERVRMDMRRMAVASLGQRRAGLLLGITIGDESLIPEKSIEEFRASGLSHLTAVSGANVAMVLASALWLLQMAHASRWTRAVMCLVVLVLFTLVTRWEPSVMRASLVAGATVTSFFFGRRTLALNSLALAYLVLLAVDPLLAWSVGFQLSFAATAGILLLGEPLSAWLRKALPAVIASAIAVTFTAQAAVTPILVWHFGQLSTVSLPANVLAFPLVAPATILGFAGAGVGAVWNAGGSAILWLAGPFLRGLEFVAHGFGSQSYSSVKINDGIEMLRLMLLYGLVVSVVLFIKGHKRAFKLVLVVCIGAWMSSFVAPVAGHSSPKAMRITFFDVGQGDAALIETPSGARVLVDGGSSDSDVAADLRRAGIHRLDLVVISHGHADHVDGLQDVVEKVSVGAIWYPGVTQGIPSALRQRALLAPDEGTIWELGDLRIEVLAPSRELVDAAGGDVPEGATTAEGSPINDAS